MSERAQHWLNRTRALPLAGSVRIMNVCGGHERSITMAGLRSLLPSQIRLILGPSWPVCICPEEDMSQRSRGAGWRCWAGPHLHSKWQAGMTGLADRPRGNGSAWH